METYRNPILAGFYPDPSICKAGDDYYLVNSSFAYFPGLPIFHSKDLVNWKQIGFALDRAEQLDLEGAGVSRGLFAPTIRFHNGTYYIICTHIDNGGNFIISAKHPAVPWSNPIYLPEVNGIDPSLFFDDNKAWLIYNSVAPGGKPLYEGHRTIRMINFDIKTMKVSGAESILVNGGSNILKKPVWIEGPHIFKKNNYYYLFCAEGGTFEEHSEVVFRSRKVEGPYIPYDKNPILTQRDLDPARPHPITCAGHADFAETNNGNWYAVFLGCRPYEDDYYNTGRETFMAPVKWKDGWPIINPGHTTVQYNYPFPLAATKTYIPLYGGNYIYKDVFKNNTLEYTWQFLRTPKTKWYSLTPQGLEMKILPETCSGKSNPAFLGHRQEHLNGYAETSLQFSASSEHEKAGMLIFQNEDHYYLLCQSIEDNMPVVQLYKSIPGNFNQMELLHTEKLTANTPVKLKIEAHGSTYAFYYADHFSWHLMKDHVDAKFLSTKVAGGFVGCMYALYASSYGRASENKALFNWFEYKGDDVVGGVNR